MTHLWWRLQEAKRTLLPVQSEYRIVFEDELDGPANILVPDPNWLAAALAGWVLPPIEAYLRDKEKQEQFNGFSFNYSLVGGAEHPYAEPIGPMTEEEAIEYLIMKDIPKHVWADTSSNRRKLTICSADQIPSDRTYRDAWSITNEAAA